MTEADWLECDDPEPMLAFLSGQASERKLRLFACVCCRLLGPLLRGEPRNRGLGVSGVKLIEGLSEAGGGQG
jgi:hypothetical protein